MNASSTHSRGPHRRFSFKALAMTVSLAILVGLSMLLLVDGLEWALLRLAGIPEWPTEIVMGVTAIPVLVVTVLFGRKVWTIEISGLGEDEQDL